MTNVSGQNQAVQRQVEVVQFPSGCLSRQLAMEKVKVLVQGVEPVKVQVFQVGLLLLGHRHVGSRPSIEPPDLVVVEA